jgi:hypothetical protein
MWLVEDVEVVKVLDHLGDQEEVEVIPAQEDLRQPMPHMDMVILEVHRSIMRAVVVVELEELVERPQQATEMVERVGMDITLILPERIWHMVEAAVGELTTPMRDM